MGDDVIMDTTEKEITAWLETINDNKFHHIGEYYTFISGKKWKTTTGNKTESFKRWFLGKFEVNEGLPALKDGASSARLV